MESTGTYWQTLFNALQAAGFEVLLVGGNQTKHVKGRKTDVIDCIWIQKLHSLGLLPGSLLLSDTFHRTADAAVAHLLLPSAAFGRAIGSLQQQDAEEFAPDEPAPGCRTQRHYGSLRHGDHRSHSGRRARASLSGLFSESPDEKIPTGD